MVSGCICGRTEASDERGSTKLGAFLGSRKTRSLLVLHTGTRLLSFCEFTKTRSTGLVYYPLYLASSQIIIKAVAAACETVKSAEYQPAAITSQPVLNLDLPLQSTSFDKRI